MVLASSSPARLALLRAGGVDPVVRVSAVDERQVLALAGITDAEPEATAIHLAQAKAQAVATGDHQLPPRALVIGADSVLELDGHAYGKPADAADVVTRWQRMRGQWGVLHTGHHVIDTATGAGAGGLVSTRVRFADVDDAEIDAYVATGEPLGVAGAFTLDGLGGAFIEAVRGDPHAVIGLGLPLLRHLFAELGHRWVDQWGTGRPSVQAAPRRS